MTKILFFIPLTWLTLISEFVDATCSGETVPNNLLLYTLSWVPQLGTPIHFV